MKIATFSTYRTVKTLHGGQIRLNAIHDIFRRDGFLVKHVAVHTGTEEDLQDDELSIPLDAEMQTYFHGNDLRQDVNACTVFDRHGHYYEAVAGFLNDFNPDILWLEQPWLWPTVKKYLRDNNRFDATIIYGSQNVECRLIDNVTMDRDTASRRQLTKEVEDLESDLCRHAQGIVAVSADDAKFFESYKKPVLVAKNGVSPMSQAGGLEYWNNALRHMSLSLFVGSAHPPNAEGFTTMLGKDLSFMAPNERIAVIGGVCHLLQASPVLRRNRGLVLPRLLLLDNQDATGLATFIKLAKSIILPIVSGGGTNLKTAEALYSRKPIVATSRAFRGYENFKNFPNVHISDDPSQFRVLLKQQLSEDAPLSAISDEQSAALDDLLWSRTLASVGRWTRQMAVDTKAIALREMALKHFKSESMQSHYSALTAEGVLLKPMLHEGWHDFEENGTWSKERIAVLKIRNPFARNEMSVTIELEILIPRDEQNAVDIYTAFDHHVSKICDFRSRNSSFRFTTKSEDLSDDNSLELYIQIQKLHKPHSASQSIDNRFLGCRIRKIVIVGAIDDRASRDVVVYKKGPMKRLRDLIKIGTRR